MKPTSYYFDLLLWGRWINFKELKATTNQIDLEKQPPVTKSRTAIFVEDKTTFWDEYSEELEYVYFGDSCHEHNDSQIPDIDFVM